MPKSYPGALFTLSCIRASLRFGPKSPISMMLIISGRTIKYGRTSYPGGPPCTCELQNTGAHHIRARLHIRVNYVNGIRARVNCIRAHVNYIRANPCCRRPIITACPTHKINPSQSPTNRSITSYASSLLYYNYQLLSACFCHTQYHGVGSSQ